MSWQVNDLLTDEDLVAYEGAILDQFGKDTWQERRTKALEDWLFPILKGRGFDPYKLRTRHEPTQAWGYTSSAYTDLTGKFKDEATDDTNLAAVFATVNTDALYIGSDKPFMGLFFRLLDSVSSAAGTMTVAYWNGAWTTLALSDGTRLNTTTLAQGGSVVWKMPVDWATRNVSSSERLYWAKVTLSAAPTGCLASQVGVIRASALRAPVTFRTLQLIFQEAPTGVDGPWRDKAQFYREEADQALSRALPIIGGEFDTDESDMVSESESEQTTETAGGRTMVWERA